MQCEKCKADRKEEDFFGKVICFKCEYARKMGMKPKKERKCRICEVLLSSKRWVYCSNECAEIGEMKQKREYWTNKVA